MRNGFTSIVICCLVFSAATAASETLPEQAASEKGGQVSGAYTYNNVSNPQDELAEIEKVIRASIEWAVKGKDTVLLYSSVINNGELFYFSTNSTGTIAGFDEFRHLTENFFMRDDFKALRVEIKDFRISMSPTMKTAWWACNLDDHNEFQGKPANWENVRWTGVLEKIDGKWRIFQMHFSKAEDLAVKEYEESQVEKAEKRE
jgi:hypothetical protein